MLFVTTTYISDTPNDELVGGCRHKDANGIVILRQSNIHPNPIDILLSVDVLSSLTLQSHCGDWRTG
jgi:hypothetical protein